MIDKEKNLNNLNDADLDPKKPLSEKELASLIKASHQGSFNSVDFNKQKEQNNDFKKVSLHDIAKQARKVIKTESYTTKVNESLEKENIDTNNVSKENIKVQEEDLEPSNKDNLGKTISDDQKEVVVNKKKEEKNIKEEAHLKKIEEESKIAYDKGRKDALEEIKEGSDAAIAELKKITESISKVEAFDLKNIELLISNKVLELSSDLSGKIIKALPTDFIKKIKLFLTELENIEGNIDIFISENDHKVIESNKDVKKEIEGLRLYSNKDLKHGEIELKVNGIKITQKIST